MARWVPSPHSVYEAGDAIPNLIALVACEKPKSPDS